MMLQRIPCARPAAITVTAGSAFAYLIAAMASITAKTATMRNIVVSPSNIPQTTLIV